MKLATVILTLNESEYVAACIESVQAVSDQVFVIDAASTDGTPDIARGLGATVITRDWQGYAQTRNAALDLCSQFNWVLFVDADERIPPALCQEIRGSLNQATPGNVGYWISRKNIICGRIMRGGGWWPDFQLRLVKPEACRYSPEDVVHETPVCQGQTFALSTPLLHLNYRSWAEFAAKQLAFARLAAARGAPPRRRSYIGAPLRCFVNRFVGESGYRDGLSGLVAIGILSASEGYRVWLARQRRS